MRRPASDGVVSIGLSLISVFLILGICAREGPDAVLFIPLLVIVTLCVISLLVGPSAPPNPRACQQCEYDLSGLPRRARCPECGRPYNLDAPPLPHAQPRRTRTLT